MTLVRKPINKNLKAATIATLTTILLIEVMYALNFVMKHNGGAF